MPLSFVTLPSWNNGDVRKKWLLYCLSVGLVAGGASNRAIGQDQPLPGRPTPVPVRSRETVPPRPVPPTPAVSSEADELAGLNPTAPASDENLSLIRRVRCWQRFKMAADAGCATAPSDEPIMELRMSGEMTYPIAATTPSNVAVPTANLNNRDPEDIKPSLGMTRESVRNNFPISSSCDPDRVLDPRRISGRPEARSVDPNHAVRELIVNVRLIRQTTGRRSNWRSTVRKQGIAKDWRTNQRPLSWRASSGTRIGKFRTRSNKLQSGMNSASPALFRCRSGRRSSMV
jgi:hypothetical protein